MKDPYFTKVEGSLLRLPGVLVCGGAQGWGYDIINNSLLSNHGPNWTKGRATHRVAERRVGWVVHGPGPVPPGTPRRHFITTARRACKPSGLSRVRAFGPLLEYPGVTISEYTPAIKRTFGGEYMPAMRVTFNLTHQGYL